ncbi:YndM family protein [Bacillus sp. DX4.1]|uniref:YndM family protein n=1 Tax=Bacillus sp. DX4.1 TaxID=3055867 RepID=UPI0025A2BBEA|nr:YndM family protein [Bacillus sp. DX4.1]MDM5188987.1 YndM family protein [Bacillus sp. DX4.1]
MGNVTVLLIKFISCIIAFAIGLDLFFDATIVDVVSFSLFVTIVSYMFVDKIILDRIGNSAAIMADFLLTYLSVWIFGNILLGNHMQIAWGSILSAIIFTLSEVFVHRYSRSHTSTHEQNRNAGINMNRRLSYGTEFAEEQNILDKDKKK